MANRRFIPRRVRRLVAERAHYCCEYCLSPENYSLDSFTIDHIIPTSRGGDDSPDNLAFACHNCNNRKQDDISAVDTEDGSAARFYNPRTERWREHFRWSEDYLTIVPVSPIGSVTVARLRLNRSGAVNIRAALVALHEVHPPALPDD
jgi:hypothetical protein